MLLRLHKFLHFVVVWVLKLGNLKVLAFHNYLRLGMREVLEHLQHRCARMVLELLKILWILCSCENTAAGQKYV